MTSNDKLYHLLVNGERLTTSLGNNLPMWQAVRGRRIWLRMFAGDTVEIIAAAPAPVEHDPEAWGEFAANCLEELEQ